MNCKVGIYCLDTLRIRPARYSACSSLVVSLKGLGCVFGFSKLMPSQVRTPKHVESCWFKVRHKNKPVRKVLRLFIVSQWKLVNSWTEDFTRKTNLHPEQTKLRATIYKRWHLRASLMHLPVHISSSIKVHTTNVLSCVLAYLANRNCEPAG